jgi:serine/threonine protein kinase
MSDYNKEAKKAKREGDYSKAGDLYYLAGDEKGAMEMYLKGNHFALAARLLEKQEDWRGAAKFYVQCGKFAEAAEIYSTRLKDFRTASALFEKNNDLARASEMSEKAGDFPRAAMLADQAELWERAAALFVQAQKYERAAEVHYRIFKKLLAEKDEKGFMESHQARLSKYGTAAGNLYSRLKNYDTAAVCYELSGNLMKAADCFLQANQPEKAAQIHYRAQNHARAYELLSTLGEAVTNKELFAEVCFQLGKFAQAGDLFILAGRPLRAAESYERGQNDYKAALLYEGNEEFMKAADLYLKLKDPKKAGELLEKAKQYEYAARIYQEAGYMDQAIECMLMASQRIAAGKLMMEKNDLQKAISILQEVHPDHEDYQEACILLGQIFTRMEMHSVAVQKFLEGTQDQPVARENIEVYYGLGLAYEKAAQYTRAREIYEKILSVDIAYKDVMDRLQQIKTMNLIDGAADSTVESAHRVLANRYEIQDTIGKDYLGVLYKAKDLSLGRNVLIRRLAHQDKNITHILQEQTRIVSALTHSNILAVYDGGKDEDHYFICMEYVEGETLRQLMSRGSVDISDICELSSQICLALGYAHKRGVIHKSLSPENIYITNGNHIKIANFGFEGKSEKGGTLVSKQYSSPEQLLGQKLDGRSDMYSVGIILYEMLYGEPPYSGEDVEAQHLKKEIEFQEIPHRNVPAFLMKLVRKCLRKDPEHRYATAEQILEELEVADIVPGMVLERRYEILKELGSGGMGHVYQAMDRELDEPVALKVLRAEISADPLIQKRFFREIKVTRMITHPNVVKVFDIGKYKGNRFISMEYIDGVGLDYWLRNNPNADLKTLLNILGKILQGVQAAHAQGIIHRDLKPQNVLLDRALNPHILDFGIARSKNNVEATSSGQVLGSPKYMSPEQIQGKDLDTRTDIYSLGVMMFFLFSGYEPFTGEDSRTVIMKQLTQPPPPLRDANPVLPAWLERIVAKALEKDRNRRYMDLKEMMEDLRKGYETLRS